MNPDFPDIPQPPIPPDSIGQLWVTTKDMQTGLARRDCRYCGGPLLIRLPSMQNAIEDARRSSERLDLTDKLTLTERLIFDAIYAHYPRPVAAAEVQVEAYGMSRHVLTVHLGRIRRKLAGWQIVTRHGTLRLIAPEEP